jgi:hypothetical protein
VLIPKATNPNYGHFKAQAHKLIDDLSPAKPWKITAVQYRKKRSNPQNSYFWTVIIGTLKTETGNDANDLHDVLCGEAFGWEEYQVLGKRKVRPVKGTSQLLVDEFESFCEWCRAYAAQNLGIVIPLPNEVM